MELAHAIGFNGASTEPLHLLGNGMYAYASGGCVVIASLSDSNAQSFLRGHDDHIQCLAVSSSGRLIASGQGGHNSDVIVWDVVSKSRIYTLQEHDNGVAHVAFSEDERFLCTVGVASDEKMVIWDMTTGCIVATCNHMKPTNCCCWGGRKKDIKGRDTTKFQLATGGREVLKYWTLDPSTGTLEEEAFNTTVTRDYTSVVFSPNRDYVFAGSTSGDFTAANVRNKVMHSVTAACSNRVMSLLPLPYLEYTAGDHTEMFDQLLVGGGDGTVTLYSGDGRAYRLAKTMTFEGAVSALQLLDSNPQSITLLVGTSKGFIYAANISDGTVRLIQENHCASVRAVAFAPDDSSAFASASEDGTVRLWDGGSYEVTAKGICQAAKTGAPSCVCFTGEVLFSGWADGKIRAHDAEDGTALWAIDECHRGGVTSLQVSHNRRFLVSGGEEGEVRCWEIRTRDMIRHLKQHTMSVTSLAVTEHDDGVVSASRDRSILFWELRGGTRTACLTQKMGGINSIALHADGLQLISVGQEKRIAFWDAREPNPIQTMGDGIGEQLCVCLSADSKYFASGGDDSVVRLWEFETGKLVHAGVGHSDRVRQLMFSPDGKQLVSVGDDGNVLVWNIYL